jgi:hypothetical protein
VKEMTPRQRLLAVIRGEIPDRVPATLHQWQVYHLNHFMLTDDDLHAFMEVGLDAVIYPPWLRHLQGENWKVTETVIERDEDSREITVHIETPGGILTQTSVGTDYTITETRHLVKKLEDIYLIKKYMPVPELDRNAVHKRKEKLGDRGILRLYTNGPQGAPWQDACFWCGTENMIYHSFDRPDWVHEFLEILLEKKIAFYKKNITPLKGVFDMIETGGGAASNTVISPDMFDAFCIPYDIRQHAVIHDSDPDIAISYHTCGGMMNLLDRISRNGCDFSETLAPVACGGDIRDGIDEIRVKTILGSKVKLMGGINQIQALTLGPKEDIYQDVERAFTGYGRGGGYIMMASDHFFHAPKDNLIRYADAVREICNYQ